MCVTICILIWNIVNNCTLKDNTQWRCNYVRRICVHIILFIISSDIIIRLTALDYHFDIFKLFSRQTYLTKVRAASTPWPYFILAKLIQNSNR